MSDRDTHLRLAEADTTPSQPGTITVTAESVRRAIDVLKGYFKRNAYEIGTFQPTDIPTKDELVAHKHCVAAGRLCAQDPGFLRGVNYARDDWKRGMRPPGTEEPEPAGLGPLATHYAVKLTNCQRGIYPNRPQANQRPARTGGPELELGIRRSLDRGIGD